MDTKSVSQPKTKQLIWCNVCKQTISGDDYWEHDWKHFLERNDEDIKAWIRKKQELYRFIYCASVLLLIATAVLAVVLLGA